MRSDGMAWLDAAPVRRAAVASRALITIDGRATEVEPGATVLDAARRLGIDIPTLCHRPGGAPHTACLVCLVRDVRTGRLLPSCSARAEEGMELESGSETVRAARRQALELLLSEHAGDCEAPCGRICPGHMDIPRMLRQIRAGELAAALATVKETLALPAVLGRICPAPCERGCRRGQVDEPVSICLLKRYVADVDLARPVPWLPPVAPSSRRRVAIVGAGPAGLSSAYYLLQRGHACTLFDRGDAPGGRLRDGVEEARLPRRVLDAEIDIIRRLGAQFSLQKALGVEIALADLRAQFDAVVLATGKIEPATWAESGLAITAAGVKVDPHTHATALAGVFAGGDLVRAVKLAVRSVGHGRALAASVDQYLAGRPVTGLPRRFDSRLQGLGEAELATWARQGAAGARGAPAAADGGLAPDVAAGESGRCLHCDCRKADTCKLRAYADAYGAAVSPAPGVERRRCAIDNGHPELVYEPGKCVLCGLCVRLSAEMGEPVGLAFHGRGFGVAVAPPLGATLAEALTQSAAACVEACPTGALAWRHAERVAAGQGGAT